MRCGRLETDSEDENARGKEKARICYCPLFRVIIVVIGAFCRFWSVCMGDCAMVVPSLLGAATLSLAVDCLLHVTIEDSQAMSGP